jgi:general secretion pathway protein D
MPACDKFVTTKYLSSDVNSDSVSRLTEPVTDESEATSFKSDDHPVVIPPKFKQEVSLLLNENLSVKSVFCELAKKLNLNFQMDPTVDAKVIFCAKKCPFIEALDSVCDLANLRYTISNDIVKVEKDTPYSVSYDIQFLNISRDSENKISVTTEIGFVTATDAKGDQTQDGNVSIKAKSDFWAELDAGIKVIVGANQKDQVTYSVNKQAGVIIVCASAKVHSSVREYLKRIKAASMSQVLIEAKIIEVSLKNEYRRGIDWALLSGRFSVKGKLLSNSSNGLSNVSPHGDQLGLTFDTSKGTIKDMNSVVGALEEFGATRMISNPRITAMNNQAAILKVAQNHVYFKLNYEKNYVNNGNNANNSQEISVSSDIKTVPLGLVMFVQPSIDMSDGTITLFLRPTITKLASSVNDPAVNIALKNSTTGTTDDKDMSKIPVIEVREVASFLKLRDGEVAILGGFMEVRSSKNKSGIPGFGDLPIFGDLVSSRGVGDEVVELVILIKVRLLNGPQHQRAVDIRLQRFVPDPRPF